MADTGFLMLDKGKRDACSIPSSI